MEKIILEGTHEQKEKILYTYGLSKRIRGYRRSITNSRAQLLSSGTFNKHRMVYDMEHDDDETHLPGKLLTNEHEDNGNGNSEQENAYKNTGITFDFYKKILQRNSIDNGGNILISSVNFADQYDNAFWNGKQMVFGNGGGGMIKKNTLTAAINVIAHELTHGVTQFTANLEYGRESGGLNESFSDVFGITCENWYNKQINPSSKPNWLIGKDIMEQGTAMRDMKGEEKVNPWDESIFSYKDYRDGIDVHFSSGISNKAFYVTVKTIGEDAWERIIKVWYIVLTQGWLSSSGPKSFQEAADGTFTVAGQLYGGDGNEVQNAVKEGWKSVDITPQQDVKPIISANTLL